MKSMHSILGMALAATVLFGCANSDTDGLSSKSEMRLESESADHGYGYEMLPLQLVSNATAPTGNNMLPNGRVAPEEVVRQATARIDSLRTCYANALAADPTLAGEVRAIHHFRADGTLQSFRIESELVLAPEFTDCMTAAPM